MTDRVAVHSLRTWQRRDNGWFGDALDSRQARIQVPGLDIGVAVDDVGEGEAELRTGVDAAYRAKYGRYGAPTVDRISSRRRGLDSAAHPLVIFRDHSVPVLPPSPETLSPPSHVEEVSGLAVVRPGAQLPQHGRDQTDHPVSSPNVQHDRPDRIISTDVDLDGASGIVDHTPLGVGEVGRRDRRADSLDQVCTPPQLRGSKILG